MACISGVDVVYSVSCMRYCRFDYEGQPYIIRLLMGRSSENRYDGELHYSSFPNDCVLIVTR